MDLNLKSIMSYVKISDLDKPSPRPELKLVMIFFLSHTPTGQTSLQQLTPKLNWISWWG